jgi:Cytochrome c oxidase assembly protein PET191
MNSCKNIREDLIDCIQHTDCYLKQNLSVRDCLRDHTDELPEVRGILCSACLTAPAPAPFFLSDPHSVVGNCI